MIQTENPCFSGGKNDNDLPAEAMSGRVKEAPTEGLPLGKPLDALTRLRLRLLKCKGNRPAAGGLRFYGWWMATDGPCEATCPEASRPPGVGLQRRAWRLPRLVSRWRVAEGGATGGEHLFGKQPAARRRKERVKESLRGGTARGARIPAILSPLSCGLPLPRRVA